jgi:hypothetical protein
MHNVLLLFIDDVAPVIEFSLFVIEIIRRKKHSETKNNQV